MKACAAGGSWAEMAIFFGFLSSRALAHHQGDGGDTTAGKRPQKAGFNHRLISALMAMTKRLRRVKRRRAASRL